MILDIRAIPEGHSTFSRSAELESVKADLPSFSDKILCRFEIDRNGPDLFVHVWYEGVFDFECARCLKFFQLPLSGDFRIVIKEAADISGGETHDDSVDFYLETGKDHVDISPAIYDEIMTNIPLMPLCSEQCRGIEISSASSQVESIDKKEIDPRWEALRKLSQNKKD